MAEIPFFQFYPGDYHAKTQHLTTVEHGAYLLLIMAAWGRKDCGLPNDDQFLAKTVKLSTRKWKAIKPSIMYFWDEQDGYIYNARLLKDRKTLQERSMIFSKSGAKGAAVKKAKSLETNKVNGSPASFSDKPPLSILEPEPEPELELELDSKKEHTPKREKQFNKFWDAFAYKSGRAPTLKAWMKISGYDGELFAQIIVGAERDAAARPDLIANGGTPKMAQGWITDRRWEDEVIPGLESGGDFLGGGRQIYPEFPDPNA